MSKEALEGNNELLTRVEGPRNLAEIVYIKIEEAITNLVIKPGDEIQVRDNSKKLEVIHSSMRRIKEGKQLPWLSLDKANLKGSILEVPNRADIPVTFNENLVVELYSK